MVCSAIYVLDQKGKILISRNYRGDVSRGIADSFSKKIQESDGNDLKPVYTEGGYTFAWIRHSNVLLLAVTRRNSNITMVLYFLHKLTEVMHDYFGNVEEESIRDNFVILYELLDETMDFGYPQIAEAGVLKEYITTESHVLAREKVKPPQAVTNMVSWRPEGITHPKEEVYLDVEERLHLIVSAGGKVMSSEIEGALKMKCYLSGMPNLKLGLNDKLMFQATGRRATAKSVELEDVKFHQCVRLAQFEHDRTISFTPPDGEFELMSYRLNTHVKPLIWVETVVERQGRSRLQYSVKAKSNYKNRTVANGVEILIPVPPDVDSPAFRATVGRVTYVPDLECLKWTIPQLTGGKEVLMRAHLGLPSVEAEDDAEENAWRTKPIRVRFEIPYFTVSGLQVRYLRVTEASGYQAVPWVRYVTLNGAYLLRMG